MKLGLNEGDRWSIIMAADWPSHSMRGQLRGQLLKACGLSEEAK